MNECIFCKIINKELPSTIVFENDQVVAIVPIDEITKGHTLVIPKQHYESIFDIEEHALHDVMDAAKLLSKKLVDEGATGVNLLNASGKDAQQSVFHFHLHIVPRRPADGLDMWIKQNL